jgi:hypothetical protein
VIWQTLVLAVLPTTPNTKAQHRKFQVKAHLQGCGNHQNVRLTARVE